MNLKDAKLGELYLCYLNNFGEITTSVCDRTMVSTILAVHKEQTGDIILGWKKDVRPNNASPRIGAIPSMTFFDWARNQELYIYYIKVNKDLMTVHSKVPGIDPNLDGCLCIKCTNFFQFAESNQTDGSFVCWSCRSFS
jgi:hypothetical protein